MESVVDRLKQFIDQTGLTIASFERSVGMSNNSFGKSLKSGGSIGSDKLQKTMSVYPNLSATWLLTGEGTMLTTEEAAPAPIAHHIDSSEQGIPFIPFDAVTAALTSDHIDAAHEFEHYVVPVFQGADFLIPLKGIAMMPTYMSGDIVACQRVPMADLFFLWGKVYLVTTSQGPLIRRIRPASDDQHVRLVSDNPDFDPLTLPISALHGVALVIGIIRLE